MTRGAAAAAHAPAETTSHAAETTDHAAETTPGPAETTHVAAEVELDPIETMEEQTPALSPATTL